MALFLADDEAGDGRVLTNEEARIVAEEGRRFFEAKWIAAEATATAEAEARRAAEAAANAEAEARRAAEATANAEAEARRAAEEARDVAEARVRELEEVLRSKG